VDSGSRWPCVKEQFFWGKDTPAYLSPLMVANALLRGRCRAGIIARGGQVCFSPRGVTGPSEYNSTVRVRRRCGLLSNYFWPLVTNLLLSLTRKNLKNWSASGEDVGKSVVAIFVTRNGQWPGFCASQYLLPEKRLGCHRLAVCHSGTYAACCYTMMVESRSLFVFVAVVMLSCKRWVFGVVNDCRQL